MTLPSFFLARRALGGWWCCTAYRVDEIYVRDLRYGLGEIVA